MGQVYRRWEERWRVTSGEKTKSGSLTAVRANSLQPAYRVPVRNRVRDDKLWDGGRSTVAGIARASFRAAGSPEQAPSFYVLPIVVRRAGSTQVLAFFRVEGCLPETCQLLRQNQKAAIR